MRQRIDAILRSPASLAAVLCALVAVGSLAPAAHNLLESCHDTVVATSCCESKQAPSHDEPGAPRHNPLTCDLCKFLANARLGVASVPPAPTLGLVLQGYVPVPSVRIVPASPALALLGPRGPPAFASV